MPDLLTPLLTAAPSWELLLIFFTKITEVSMGTVRYLLVHRGYRKLGALLAFFEVTLWVFVASRVITGIAEAPLKGIVYSVAYAVGVYLGSKLEARLALGEIMIQTITPPDRGALIADSLRGRGLGVTRIEAHGKDSGKSLLLVFASRRREAEIIRSILALDGAAMITSHHATHLRGGHFQPGRQLAK